MMYEEVEEIWKEAVAAQWRYSPGICSKEMSKITKDLI
jgi:hypothetical protein